MRRDVGIALLLALVAPIRAQEAGIAAPPAETTNDATTLETIRVTAPRPETLDLYKFGNPIKIEGSRFDHDMYEPPTVEEVSLQGGYILLGINYGLMKLAQQAKKLPGFKDQIQSATARPPPLDEGQMDRAMRAWEAPDSEQIDESSGP
ncbi:MAG: hypothetical protein QM599_08830 [Pseudoxanthomonas sp.]